jgi:hypothetical protein
MSATRRRGRLSPKSAKRAWTGASIILERGRPSSCRRRMRPDMSAVLARERLSAASGKRRRADGSATQDRKRSSSTGGKARRGASAILALGRCTSSLGAGARRDDGASLMSARAPLSQADRSGSAASVTQARERPASASGGRARLGACSGSICASSSGGGGCPSDCTSLTRGRSPLSCGRAGAGPGAACGAVDRACSVPAALSPAGASAGLGVNVSFGGAGGTAAVLTGSDQGSECPWASARRRSEVARGNCTVGLSGISA